MTLQETLIMEKPEIKNSTDNDFQIIFDSKRTYFDSGSTRSYKFRIEQLKKLKKAVQKYEAEIYSVLKKDLHKPGFEAYAGEIGLVYAEINHALKDLKYWMQPESKATPIVMAPSYSKVYNQPQGVVLIIGPWNYPFQLLISPLVGAIAAGNCVILKPSENTVHTAALIEKIISETFDSKYISVVQGPGDVIGTTLIKRFKFNHIFFTGSANVGKKIMAMAAEHLTPTTLELGGKSPAIIDKNANINVSVKRLAWGKCFNAGQTCISPDYLLVHESIKDTVVAKLKQYFTEFYNGNALQSEHYAHIVNEKRFNTLVSYLNNVNIVHGGKYDAATRCIEPTLVDNVPENHPLKNEEIFGPILPVYTFKNIEEVIPVIRKNRYPLSCYVFTKSKKTKQFIIDNIEFGGGCVNNTLIQFGNTELPLGGCGQSGIGQYHGKYTFEAFSHKKSVIHTYTFIDPALRYAPFTKIKNKILQALLK